MKLIFKQRMFSWFDSYDIYDECGNTVYQVEGKLSWGHKLVVYDQTGREVGMVKQEVLTFLPKFEIYIGGEYAGCLSKELTLFKPRYDIDYNGWHVDGGFLEWDYTIVDPEGAEVAVITKDVMHLTDTYEIEVYNPEDALGALLFVLAIDAEKCSRSK